MSKIWTMSGMLQRGDSLSLGAEPGELLGPGVGTGQDHLQRHGAIEQGLSALYTTPMPPRPSSPRMR